MVMMMISKGIVISEVVHLVHAKIVVSLHYEMNIIMILLFQIITTGYGPLSSMIIMAMVYKCTGFEVAGSSR